MMPLPKTLFLAGSLVAAGASLAHGDPSEPADHHVPAPTKAFEVTIGGGYIHSAGNTSTMEAISDVSGAGGNIELGVAYRINPKLAIALYGSGYQVGSTGVGDSDAFGMTAGIRSDWHFRPNRSVDPWISSGGGWRGMWLDQPGEDTVLQGVDLLNLRAGVDYRYDKDFALSPYVGIAATKYLSESSGRTDGYEEIDDKQIDWTFNAGVQMRFDVNGTYVD
jgi:hypothetical protein